MSDGSLLFQTGETVQVHVDGTHEFKDTGTVLVPDIDDVDDETFHLLGDDRVDAVEKHAYIIEDITADGERALRTADNGNWMAVLVDDTAHIVPMNCVTPIYRE